jgi:uncharacterized protein YndB with AHSA1/START domain
MILIIAVVAFILVTTFFILDASQDQDLSSEISTYLTPFFTETIVKQSFASTPELIWGALTQLSDYNFWFPGVLRLLPVVETSRYVHKYSFDQFKFAPGSEIRLRPFSLSPTFKGQITAIENNKQLAMELRFNPLHKETVIFNLEPTAEGTSVTCRRSSRGLFSWMTLWGFSKNKSKILENLGYFIPEQIIEEKADDSSLKETGPQYSREAIIARAVQAGLDGNVDLVNAIPDKPTRGMAKAMLIQSKRKGNVLPEHLVKALSEEPSEAKPTTKKESAPSDTPSNGLLPAFENKDDLVAYVVNKALDGDDEPINALSDKPTRGKAKAMMVKIKRGTVERPEMPVASQDPSSSKSEKNTVAKLASEEVSNDKESDDEVISRLIAAGLDGNMDEINALENRVLRGKIKAGIVKAKRAQN